MKLGMRYRGGLTQLAVGTVNDLARQEVVEDVRARSRFVCYSR